MVRGFTAAQFIAFKAESPVYSIKCTSKIRSRYKFRRPDQCMVCNINQRIKVSSSQPTFFYLRVKITAAFYDMHVRSCGLPISLFSVPNYLLVVCFFWIRKRCVCIKISDISLLQGLTLRTHNKHNLAHFTLFSILRIDRILLHSGEFIKLYFGSNKILGSLSEKKNLCSFTQLKKLAQ